MKKPRIWDSKLLADTHSVSLQIQTHIENMEQQLANINIEEFPHSMVPTQTLYNLVICYNLAYNLLLDNELLKSGNNKQEIRMLQ